MTKKLENSEKLRFLGQKIGNLKFFEISGQN